MVSQLFPRNDPYAFRLWTSGHGNISKQQDARYVCAGFDVLHPKRNAVALPLAKLINCHVATFRCVIKPRTAIAFNQDGDHCKGSCFAPSVGRILERRERKRRLISNWTMPAPDGVARRRQAPI